MDRKQKTKEAVGNRAERERARPACSAIFSQTPPYFTESFDLPVHFAGSFKTMIFQVAVGMCNWIGEHFALKTFWDAAVAMTVVWEI